MSSSEEYLDSLLESILNGGKSNNTAESPAQQDMSGENVLAESAEDNRKPQTGSVHTNKAMSTEEIEEMLKSMGTLGGEQKAAEEMPVTAQTEEPATADSSLDDFALGDLSLEESGLDDFNLDNLETGEDSLGAEGAVSEDLSLDGLSMDNLNLGETASDDLSLGDQIGRAHV